MEKLLIVDDNAEIRKQLKWGLAKEYRIILAGNVDDAVKQFDEHSPKVITLDLGLPPDIDGATEGLRCLQTILKKKPTCKIIVLSGNEDQQNALAAIDLGAYDYYHKPIDLDELKIIISRAFHLSVLEMENQRLQARITLEGAGYCGLLGNCPQVQQVFTTIKKVASIDVPVLVLGDSGTGKELVARAIHAKGNRNEGNFIAINCGAIPESLLESELFGHEKGAFTGAQNRVQGKVEYAHGGTLFLDEIGEMPPLLQVKLLRFLQEKVIQRVGGREDIPVDVRIIAATNIDIQDSISNGSFREDLYYRLGVISCVLPPLRERGDDIDLLANFFLQRFASEFDKKVRGFSTASIALLHEYGWPGNVRELENKVKRAVVMTDTAIIEPLDLGFDEISHQDIQSDANSPLQGLSVSGMTLKEAKNKVEREVLVAAIEQNGGNIVKTAESLEVSRPTLYDLLKKHGLHSPVN